MFVISRFVNFICLNSKEYVLDDDGDIKLFSTEKEAETFLLDAGASPDEIGECYHIEPKPE